MTATLNMTGWRYLLHRACPAVTTNGKLGEHTVRTISIPKGETIDVTGGPFNGYRIVDVVWKLTPYMVFTDHLRGCGKRVPEPIESDTELGPVRLP